MGLDPLSPAVPARLNTLILPVGRIKRSRFLHFVDRLQPENVVRLGDVTPDGRPNRSMRLSSKYVPSKLTLTRHVLATGLSRGENGV